MPFFVFAVLIGIIIVILVIDSYRLAVKDERIMGLESNQLDEESLEIFIGTLERYVKLCDCFGSDDPHGNDEACFQEKNYMDDVRDAIKIYLEERC